MPGVGDGGGGGGYLVKLSWLQVQNQTALEAVGLCPGPTCGINRIAESAEGALGSATSSPPTLDRSREKSSAGCNPAAWGKRVRTAGPPGAPLRGMQPGGRESGRLAGPRSNRLRRVPGRPGAAPRAASRGAARGGHSPGQEL